ncbi:DUF6907 domain-containing protein [Allonocardiopsis opalescens]|uniref:Uncharacterized protein n=1 Tax=Allonocardiopsis opalescens TaxID=1144618 RepID=A0A2T0QA57_9ACTN|nr:hypothetical protein [Allonocardiopsis opalescens]PRY00692.1 hypothetical protein CLV72_102323 [Allonocardiopsis opalescens]
MNNATPNPEIPAATRPGWLTGPCPAWCDGRHDESDGPDDRLHHGEFVAVPMSLLAQWKDSDPGEPGGWHLQMCETSLEQGYREAEPRVLIWLRAMSEEEHVDFLTVDEAEEFAHAILDQVRQARDGGPSQRSA